MTDNHSLQKTKYLKILQFVIFFLLLIIFFHNSLQNLISFSFSSGPHSLKIYSYISLIPLVSIYFIFQRRKKIFLEITYSFLWGIIVIISGFILYFLGKQWIDVISLNDYLSFMILSFLILFVGGFIFFFGYKSFRNAFFPLCFLLFMIPLPAVLLEHFVFFLQKSSTEVTYWLFLITGVPFEREGYVFTFSNLAIEVAKECSGIRSSLILIMTSLVFGQLFLKTNIKRVILVCTVLPITIFKNALRIYMLSVLGNYVSADILSSTIHRSGGIPFFIFSIILLALVVRVLQKGEPQILNQNIKPNTDNLTKGGT